MTAAAVSPSPTSKTGLHPLAGRRIVWVTRSFLDYRVPVFAEVDRLLGHSLTLIYSKEYIPARVSAKVEKVLGDRAVGLSGEWKFGPEDRAGMANKTFSLRYQPGIAKHIKAARPEVLVGDGFFKWTFAAFSYRLRHGVPLMIAYERTFHTERNAQWIRQAFRKRVVAATSAMCCSGRLCQEYTEYLGMPADRITLGHMVAETDGLAERAAAVSSQTKADLRARLGVQGLMFVYVGAITPRKGIMELLRGWKQFCSTASADATLVLVGDGDQRAACEAYMKEQGIDRVVFAGAVDYDSLTPYYAAADAFIIATLEDNWSLVVPEAMASGLPVLTSIYNGCWPELAQKDRNGWTFDPMKPDDIAKAVADCVAAKDRLAAMGRESQAIIADHTPTHAATAILDACQIALQRPR